MPFIAFSSSLFFVSFAAILRLRFHWAVIAFSHYRAAAITPLRCRWAAITPLITPLLSTCRFMSFCRFWCSLFSLRHFMLSMPCRWRFLLSCASHYFILPLFADTPPCWHTLRHYDTLRAIDIISLLMLAMMPTLLYARPLMRCRCLFVYIITLPPMRDITYEDASIRFIDTRYWAADAATPRCHICFCLLLMLTHYMSMLADISRWYFLAMSYYEWYAAALCFFIHATFHLLLYAIIHAAIRHFFAYAADALCCRYVA